jgi:hypothetical protein
VSTPDARLQAAPAEMAAHQAATDAEADIIAHFHDGAHEREMAASYQGRPTVETQSADGRPLADVDLGQAPGTVT